MWEIVSSVYGGFVRQDRTVETELHQNESVAEQNRSLQGIS